MLRSYARSALTGGRGGYQRGVRLTFCLLAFGALAATPATADASQLFTGKTGQSRTARIEIADNGRPAKVTISWKATCRRGTLWDVSTVRPPRRTTTADLVALAGRYRIRARRGITATVTLRLQGVRGQDPVDDGAQLWTGAFTVRVVVRRGRRVIDRCRVAETVWSARPPLVALPDATPAAPPTTAPSSSPSTAPPPSQPQPAPEPYDRNPTPGPWKLEMDSDSGDYIGGGQKWVHQPPHDQISLSGGTGVVSAGISTGDGGNWSVDFAAPRGGRLAPGRYTDARRYPFNDGNPGLSISGMGRGCNTLTGEFTISEMTYDQHGRIKTFKATFEQHCEGGEAALTGSFDFAAA